MRNILKPLLALFVFLMTQAIVSVIVMLIGIVIALLTGEISAETFAQEDSQAAVRSIISPNIMSISLIASSVISILIMVWPMKMFDFKRDFSPSGTSFGLGLLAIAGAAFGMFATDLLNELIELPNLIENVLSGMSATVLGALSIAVVGPLAEEVVFRGAIMGYMLRKGSTPTMAIITSALIFGLMHMNPAQIPFATIVGVILGVIYYRTGNIILTSTIHIINNSLAALLMNVCDEETKMSDAIGGSTIGIIVASAVCIFASYMLLRYFWNHTRDIDYVEKKTLEAASAEKQEA